jgi:hypothetical protein
MHFSWRFFGIHPHEPLFQNFFDASPCDSYARIPDSHARISETGAGFSTYRFNLIAPGCG